MVYANVLEKLLTSSLSKTFQLFLSPLSNKSTSVNYIHFGLKQVREKWSSIFAIFRLFKTS